MRLRVPEQSSNSSFRRLRLSGRGEGAPQDEAARGIHERDAIEVTVRLGANRHFVDLERQPGFVDFEIVSDEASRLSPS